MNFINKIKNLYKAEWLWRTFVVTQIFGIVAIFILDITDLDWNLFGLLKSFTWRHYALQNCIALFAIFLPFTLTKAVDWILSAKEKQGN